MSYPCWSPLGADGWRHGRGSGGGWGWLWAPIVLLLWAGLIATVVWFVARGARPPQALRRGAGQGRAGRAVRRRRTHHRRVPGTAGAAAVSRREAGARTATGL